MSKEKDLIEFDKLKAESSLIGSKAMNIEVSNFETSDIAIAEAKQIKALINAVEKKRKELVAPFNDRVKFINGYAKQLEEPLLRAEAHIKRQLAGFQDQQERIRMEKLRQEQEIQREIARKAEEERQAREAEAEAKRQEELAAAEAEADLARQAAEMFGGSVEDPEETRRKVEEEHERQRAEEQARAEREEAIRVAEAKEREYAINDMRIKNSTKVWEFEIVDPSLIPRQFLKIDESAIKRALKENDGAPIPGVRAWQSTQVRIGEKTSVSMAAIASDERKH